MWRKESLRKTGRKEDRGKEEREGRQKEEIKEAKQTTRKGKEEKGKVRWRVEEKDGGGERGVEGRKKKKQNDKHNNYNPRCEIILAAKSSSDEFPDKL